MFSETGLLSVLSQEYITPLVFDLSHVRQAMRDHENKAFGSSKL
jgi:hypothetical protein